MVKLFCLVSFFMSPFFLFSFPLRDLISAIEQNEVKVVEEQIDKGFDLNQVYKPLSFQERRKYKDGVTPLSAAVVLDNYRLTELLLENGADPNYGESPKPLVFALRNSNLKIMKLLLVNGADPDYGFYSFDTPLLVADSVPELSLLAEFGADLNRQVGRSGLYEDDTALIAAAKKGDVKILAFLLNQGAELELRNSFKGGALQNAVYYGNIEAARFLMKNQAEIDARNVYGQTALMLACMAGNPRFVELLLDYGAEPRLLDNRDKNAVDYAVESGNKKVVALLNKSVDLK